MSRNRVIPTRAACLLRPNLEDDTLRISQDNRNVPADSRRIATEDVIDGASSVEPKKLDADDAGKTSLRIAPAVRAPRTWKKANGTKRPALSLPAKTLARLIAGLTWAPETPPRTIPNAPYREPKAQSNQKQALRQFNQGSKRHRSCPRHDKGEGSQKLTRT